MTVLRSREIASPKTTPCKPKKSRFKLEPSTPAQTHDPPTASTTSPPFPNSPNPNPNSNPNPNPKPDSRSAPVSGEIRRRSLRLALKIPDPDEGKSLSADERDTAVSMSEEAVGGGGGGGGVGDEVEAQGTNGGEVGFYLFGKAVTAAAVEEGGEALKMDLGEEEKVEGDEGERGLSKLGFGYDLGCSGGNGSEEGKKKRKFEIDINVPVLECEGGDGGGNGFLSLRSGKKVTKRGVDGGGNGELAIDLDADEKGERKLGESGFVLNGVDIVVLDSEDEKERASENVFRSSILRGKRKFSVETEGAVENFVDEVMAAENGKHMGESGVVFDGVDVVKLDSEEEVERSSPKGKRKLSDVLEGVAENLEDAMISVENGIDKGRMRYSSKEKGKGKLVEEGMLLLNGNGEAELGKPEVLSSVENVASILIRIRENVALHDENERRVNNVNTGENVALRDESRVNNSNTRENVSRVNEYMERFRDIARKNAARFALFTPEEEVENRLSPRAEVAEDIEDWPGPFSTAMKIIKDREAKNAQGPSKDQTKPAFVNWVPKKSPDCPPSKILIPSLQDMCLSVLAKNADAVVSLENVADALRHQLSQLLCDSRKMNSHFFELLVQGSPTEVRLRDCSWMTEEQFTKSFQQCDISNLTVLQLDQCGRCMPDYILHSTLARSSNCLPALITLSITGACRLSDVGLGALVSSAPALRSLNLSQCSLLTSSSISTLADSLGSVLRELYLNDCQGIDPMLSLPALKKFEHLEVLSLAGNENVCDDFIRQFITVCGHSLKELVLTDCVKLTDSSVKVIAETCSGLCALDLVNLYKLTDATLGYLANDCRAIQSLKFCRNAFSDEAIAAFLETSGECLIELSLNNIKKVGHNTAISLAKRSRKLHTLDLSWCRNLTDDTLGLIVDSCLSLRMLKLFGCTQITNTFLDGHSNPEVRIIGLKVCPILEHVKMPDPHEGPLRYSSVS